MKKGSGEEPQPKPETEEDREAKRHKQALALVPDGSTCLPLALKEPGAPQLLLAAVNELPRICAVDTDHKRLLGTVGCWEVDLEHVTLSYKGQAPLPGVSVPASFHDHCAKGFCVPEDSKADGKVALLSAAFDGKRTAMLVGDEVHTFDADKKHDKSWSIRGPKGLVGEPTAIHFVGDSIFIEGGDANGVWVYKADGTPVGPITAVGAGKDAPPLSTHRGSFVAYDVDRVAVAEQGFTAVTIYEVATGKKKRVARKVNTGSCKKEELDAYWKDSEDGIGEKCKKQLAGQFGHLINADVVAGQHNLLVLLRGPRLGEFAIMNPDSLVEKKSMMMPWCEASASAGGGGGADDKADKAEKSTSSKKDAKKTTRGAKSKDEDPEQGGE